MAKTDDRVPPLAGSAEGAAILGVSRQRFNVLKSKPGFPEPVAQLTCGDIYLAADLEVYARSR